MHYRNGREAKPGDKVVCIPHPNAPVFTGIVHTIQPQASSCNARLAIVTPNDPYITLGDCLHVDDIAEAFPKPEAK